jgi:hypothetical protein
MAKSNKSVWAASNWVRIEGSVEHTNELRGYIKAENLLTS